jgi:Rps23 Pro-64 3,4-dihydroxylase Tpa1-like proline 4-hydroxylase
MKDSVEAQSFTETLLSTVRLQRHLGARIFVSTQEPTIPSDLLSLCSITIVHRFSSPAWLRALQGHVAAAAFGAQSNKESTDDHEVPSKYALFHKIVRLHVGEALLFGPNAVSSITAEGSTTQKLGTLGGGYMAIKVRDRLTGDSGKSVMSS